MLVNLYKNISPGSLAGGMFYSAGDNALKPPVCPHFSRVVWKFQSGHDCIVKRVRCKSWQCDYCQPKNREMWRSHLKKRIGKIGGVWYFVTMTAHEAFRSATDSLKNIRSNIDRIMKRLRRIFGGLDYVRVYEVHKSGAFHAHFIIRGLSDRVQKFIGKNAVEYFRATSETRGKGNWSIRTYLRRTCRQCGMGYMVDVQRISGVQKITNYIVKYMTKEAQVFYVKNLRRIQTSRRIGSPKTAGDGTWQSEERLFGSSVQYASIWDADLKIRINSSYWQHEVAYPPDL